MRCTCDTGLGKHVEHSYGGGYILYGRGHGREGTLYQTDWDWPALAQEMGWSLRRVQKRRGHAVELKHSPPRGHGCDHRGTDGTVTCPDCGVTAHDFISAAYNYLDSIAR